MRNFSYNNKIKIMAEEFIEKFSDSEYNLQFFPPEFKMNNKDVESLKEIENACFAPGMSDADKMPGYIEDNNVFAFREKDNIISAILFKERDNHRRPGEKIIFIEDLLVSPDYQQRGFGKKLLTIVLKLADSFKVDVALESPPRNQKYYSQFGFNIIRGESSGEWLAKDRNGKIFPIKKLCMWRHYNYSNQLSYSDKEEKNQSSDNQEPATLAQMEIVKKFALFALASTGFWYSHFGHSAEKEKAMGTIKDELDIHTSTINQKRSLSRLGLAAMTVAIIRNSLVIRGWGDSLSTNSSIAIYELLSGKSIIGVERSSNLKPDEIKVIKNLISDKTMTDYRAYINYSIFRKTFSGSQNRSQEKSPYYYYEDFNPRNSSGR